MPSLSHNHVTQWWPLTRLTVENSHFLWLGTIVRDTLLKFQMPTFSGFPIEKILSILFLLYNKVFLNTLGIGFCGLGWEHQLYLYYDFCGNLRSDFQTTKFQKKKSCKCLSWEAPHPFTFIKRFGQNYNWQLVLHVHMFMSARVFLHRVNIPTSSHPQYYLLYSTKLFLREGKSQFCFFAITLL